MYEVQGESFNHNYRVLMTVRLLVPLSVSMKSQKIIEREKRDSDE